MTVWKIKRVEDIAHVNPTVKLSKGIEYPFIDIDKVSSDKKFVINKENKIYDGQGSSKFACGDTLFSRITPCLENRKIAQAKLNTNKIGFGSTEFYVFRAKENEADKDFIYYLTQSDHIVLPAINSMSGASGRQRANKKFIERLKLRIPDLPTQKRIADILSAYDDLIENNNRRIAILEKSAQELYKEWFVRFRFPNYEKAKFVNGLPEGWEVVRFGDIVEIIDGDRGKNYPSQKDFCSDRYCVFLNAGNVTSTGFNFDSSYFITKEKDNTLRKGKLSYGDIVLTTRGTVGNVAYYHKNISFKNLRINSGMVILRNKIKKLNQEYMYYFLRDTIMQRNFILYASGSAQPQLPIKDMKKIKVLFPITDIVEEYHEAIKENYEQIINLSNTNANLAKQRDLLLPRLMSGKLEV